MIRAGELRERVTVQIASGTTNAFGETLLVWSDSSAVWASVQGQSARELPTPFQKEATISHRVRLRYLPGLTQQMRFSWRSRTLEIVSLLEHENRSEHEAVCTEKRDG
jgi:SPP1 family predicted phage head-tail adaptor